MSALPPLKIIGIGSPFGDDQVGWEAIRRLQQRLPATAAVQLIALDRPGCGLIQTFRDADCCWLIDALGTPGPAGRYLQPGLGELASHCAPVAGAHGWGLLETLQLATTLGMLPSRLELHCITIGGIELSSERLSDEVCAGVDQLVTELCKRLRLEGWGECRP